MTFRDWFGQAYPDRHNNLFFFNALNEVDFEDLLDRGERRARLDSADIPDRFREFDNYLRQNPGGDCSDLLYDFFAECGEETRAGASIADQEGLLGIKGFGGFSADHDEVELSALDLSRNDCSAAIEAVNSKIRDLRESRPDQDQVLDEEKEEINRLIQKGFRTNQRWQREERSQFATFELDDHTDIAPTALSDEFVWLTREAALNEECTDPTDTTHGLLRSGYIAKVRNELGIYHASDGDGDMGGAIQYRIFIKMSAAFNSEDLGSVRQPTIFSRGFDDVFVSRMPAELRDGDIDQIPGRTVRMVDTQCDHGGGELEDCDTCGTEGLPEVVVPRAHFFEKGQLENAGAYVAFASDLRRYTVPSPRVIRQKNPSGISGARDG